MIIEFNGKSPKIDTLVFIAPTAVIIGDVEIKAKSSIWYGSVLRGDLAPIRIGCNTNIQDNCTLHTDSGIPLQIAENVTVGHNSVVHGCTIERNSLIGIGSIILNKANIKTGTILAAGSLVMEGQELGPLQLFAGTPAVKKKELPKQTIEFHEQGAINYHKLSLDHMKIRQLK